MDRKENQFLYPKHGNVWEMVQSNTAPRVDEWDPVVADWIGLATSDYDLVLQYLELSTDANESGTGFLLPALCPKRKW